METNKEEEKTQIGTSRKCTSCTCIKQLGRDNQGSEQGEARQIAKANDG